MFVGVYRGNRPWRVSSVMQGFVHLQYGWILKLQLFGEDARVFDARFQAPMCWGVLLSSQQESRRCFPIRFNHRSFEKSSCFPCDFYDFLKRRIPGKNGNGNYPWKEAKPSLRGRSDLDGRNPLSLTLRRRIGSLGRKCSLGFPSKSSNQNLVVPGHPRSFLAF